MKKLLIVILLVCGYIFVDANTDTLVINGQSSLESNLNIAPIEDSLSLTISYIDNTPKSCKDIILKLLEFLVALIVPLSSVWLAYKSQKSSTKSAEEQKRMDIDAEAKRRQMELDQQEKQRVNDIKRQNDRNLHEQKIQKQAEILSLLNSLYKKCVLKQYPTQEDLIDASNQIISSYPYIGEEMNKQAVEYFGIIESVSHEQRKFSDTERESLDDHFRKYIEQYNEFINQNRVK